MFQLLLSALVKYLQNNPAQVEALVEQLVNFIINELKKTNG